MPLGFNSNSRNWTVPRIFCGPSIEMPTDGQRPSLGGLVKTFELGNWLPSWNPNKSFNCSVRANQVGNPMFLSFFKDLLVATLLVKSLGYSGAQHSSRTMGFLHGVSRTMIAEQEPS